MKRRIAKKLNKANGLYYHSRPYTLRETMHSYYFWKKYVKRYGKKNHNNKLLLLLEAKSQKK